MQMKKKKNEKHTSIFKRRFRESSSSGVNSAWMKQKNQTCVNTAQTNKK